MLLLCCCGVCKPAPILLLCVLLLCAAGLWFAVGLVIVLREQFLVCFLMEFACDEVCKTILDNIFSTTHPVGNSKNFIQKYLIGKGLFRQHKKWPNPALRLCFRTSHLCVLLPDAFSGGTNNFVGVLCLAKRIRPFCLSYLYK